MSERSAAPFDVKTVVWLVIAGALAFIGFLFLSAYAPQMRARSGLAFAPLSKNATGFIGIMRLVGDVTGETVATVHDNEGYNEPGLLIVPLAPDSDIDVMRKFARERADNVPDGTTLFVLPKWQTVPAGLFTDRVQRIGMVDSDILSKLAGSLGRITVSQGADGGRLRDVERGIDRPLPQSPMTLAGSIEPVVALPNDRIVLGRAQGIEGGGVYLLADPDLIANHALKTTEGARAAVAIIEAVRPPEQAQISIDPNPAREAPAARNLLQLMFEPPFLAVTTAVLAAAVLAGIHAFGRFGPTVPEPRAIPFGKRALVDNAARLFARAGATRRLGDRYVAVVRDSASVLLGTTARTESELEAMYGPDFQLLATRARAARDTETMRAAAAALHAWKEAVTHDRR